MKALSGILVVLLLVVPQAAGENAVESQAVEFKNDLIPVFTKMGCNAGACHGAAIGRGGFKLSLFGGNPEADYDSIVRRASGRRVNLAKPDESIIYLKPTSFLSHGGRTRFDEDSESAKMLLDWIRRGAPFESSRTLSSVEITPKRQVLESLGEPIALRATAHYSDGSKRDVTKWTVFTAEDSSSVEVDAESAESKVLAAYPAGSKAGQVNAPPPPPPVDPEVKP